MPPPTFPLQSTLSPLDDRLIQVRLVYQKQDGTGMLFYLPVLRDDTGQQFMEKLRDMAYHLMLTHSQLNIMWCIVVEKAEVDFVNGRSQPRTPPMNVNLHNNSTNPVLTKAFQDPTLLSAKHNFAEQDPSLIVDTAGTLDSGIEKAIVIRKVLRKSIAIAILFAMFVVACGAGVLGGFLTRQIQVGIAVAACIFAFLSIGQALIIGLQMFKA